jgi:hypothetical protein
VFSAPGDCLASTDGLTATSVQRKREQVVPFLGVSIHSSIDPRPRDLVVTARVVDLSTLRRIELVPDAMVIGEWHFVDDLGQPISLYNLKSCEMGEWQSNSALVSRL